MQMKSYNWSMVSVEEMIPLELYKIIKTISAMKEMVIDEYQQGRGDVNHLKFILCRIQLLCSWLVQNTL